MIFKCNLFKIYVFFFFLILYHINYSYSDIHAISKIKKDKICKILLEKDLKESICNLSLKDFNLNVFGIKSYLLIELKLE